MTTTEVTTTTHQVTGTTRLLSLPCGCLTYGSLATELCDEHAEQTIDGFPLNQFQDGDPDFHICACGCDTPLTDQTGSDWCGRYGGTIHPDHHAHRGACD